MITNDWPLWTVPLLVGAFTYALLGARWSVFGRLALACALGLAVQAVAGIVGVAWGSANPDTFATGVATVAWRRGLLLGIGVGGLASSILLRAPVKRQRGLLAIAIGAATLLGFVLRFPVAVGALHRDPARSTEALIRSELYLHAKMAKGDTWNPMFFMVARRHGAAELVDRGEAAVSTIFDALDRVVASNADGAGVRPLVAIALTLPAPFKSKRVEAMLFAQGASFEKEAVFEALAAHDCRLALARVALLAEAGGDDGADRTALEIVAPKTEFVVTRDVAGVAVGIEASTCAARVVRRDAVDAALEIAARLIERGVREVTFAETPDCGCSVDVDRVQVPNGRAVRLLAYASEKDGARRYHGFRRTWSRVPP